MKFSVQPAVQLSLFCLLKPNLAPAVNAPFSHRRIAFHICSASFACAICFAFHFEPLSSPWFAIIIFKHSKTRYKKLSVVMTDK